MYVCKRNTTKKKKPELVVFRFLFAVKVSHVSQILTPHLLAPPPASPSLEMASRFASQTCTTTLPHSSTSAFDFPPLVWPPKLLITIDINIMSYKRISHHAELYSLAGLSHPSTHISSPSLLSPPERHLNPTQSQSPSYPNSCFEEPEDKRRR